MTAKTNLLTIVKNTLAKKIKNVLGNSQSTNLDVDNDQSIISNHRVELIKNRDKLKNETSIIGYNVTSSRKHVSCTNINSLIGSNVLETIEKKFQANEKFSKIEVGSIFDCEFILSDSERKIVMTADDNLLDVIDVKIIDDVLKIDLKVNHEIQTFNPAKLTIYNDQNVQKVNTSGISKFKSEQLVQQDLSLVCGGSSEIKISGNISYLIVKSSGSGKAKIEKTNTIETTIKSQGDSRVDFDGSAKIFVLNAEGGSELKANCQYADEIEIMTYGSSTINIQGDCRKLDLCSGGSGKIDASSLKSKTARLIANGAADIKFKATDFAEIDAQGAASIEMVSYPERTKMNIGGVATVK